jgi:DNA repair protein RecN (Recombination protein N)
VSLVIVELTIRNFAIIEELRINFHEGFNVLTGETGAGKSILLDALGLLLGNRASSEWVRHGAKKAEIEGLFFIGNHTKVIEKLKELGIETDDEMLVIRRDLTDQGKSICRINGQLATISMLRELGDLLVSLHSQHDHQHLLQPHRHLFWLDEYAGPELAAALKEYKKLYQSFHKLRKELEFLSQNEKEMVQRIDLLKFQAEEIQQAALEVGEEERLLEEKNRLTHSEKISHHVQGAHEALAGEHKTLDWLGMAMGYLEEVSNLDPYLKHKFQQIEESFYLLEDITRELGNYLDRIEFDEKKLMSIEDRIHTINGLKRKYGDSIMAILEYAASIEEELEQLENRDVLLNNLYEELKEARIDLLLESKEITRLRKQAAAKLEEAVKKELMELYMDKVQFRVHIEDLSTDFPENSMDIPGGEYGMNEVEFLIATNPGEPLKPLAKVASGGELSRLALALRTVLARIDEVGTLVFDEVDTGVSGKVSQGIGQKLLRISKDRQVLAITHHPQVASLADAHYLIEKKVDGNRTKTSLQLLDEDERTLELARMIGGTEISSSARIHAAEMRRLGKELKRSM